MDKQAARRCLVHCRAIVHGRYTTMNKHSTNGRRNLLQGTADRTRRRRDAALRLTTIVALVLLLVLNDALLMRVLFLALLVPLFVDMQRRLWHAAQRRFADDMLACAEVAAAEYHQSRQREG